MKWAVASYDLTGATPDDYAKAHEVLTELGFITFTRWPKVNLPVTVVMREIEDGTPATEIRDVISREFRRAGLTPKRIFGGVLDDWAAIGDTRTRS
jgi:hypothetical protein